MIKELELIKETKQSYYEYVIKIHGGCQQIATYLRSGELDNALSMIANFSEGLEWLYNVEKYMLSYKLQIHSRIAEAMEVLKKVNQALEIKDVPALIQLFDLQLASIFDSASEWTFEEILQ